eukprot:m.794615 g.794615  ORF g.794615 m.794615 type:complete len:205 (+) comp23339_c0_seq10:65-679(+)
MLPFATGHPRNILNQCVISISVHTPAVVQCDGAAPIFKNVPLLVVGGGDTAMEEASYLSKYGSVVYIVHRRDEFRASKVMVERARANPKIKFLMECELVEVVGDSKVVTGGRVRNNSSGEIIDLDLGGVFYAIGHDPATAFLNGQVALDSAGYIVTAPDSTATSIPGVFAAGDVQDHVWRQAVTAAGTGCMAALEAERFLSAKL